MTNAYDESPKSARSARTPGTAGRGKEAAGAVPSEPGDAEAEAEESLGAEESLERVEAPTATKAGDTRVAGTAEVAGAAEVAEVAGDTGTADVAGKTGTAGADPFALSVTDLADLQALAFGELGQLRQERDEYLAAVQRLQADFDNYRKRTLRQQTETLARANEGLLARLLPVLDALDLAMAHLDATDPDEAATSFLQIGTLLRETLQREGLERIDSVGVRFDPTIHDAVAHEPAEVGPDVDEQESAGAIGPVTGPVVSKVMRAGYLLKGKVVRPAMVGVRG